MSLLFLQNKSTERDKLLWAGQVLFVVAFSGFLLAYAIQPLFDPDFWWHLKTGQVIFEQQSFLSADPFSYSGDGVVAAREKLILNGYWLWQVAAYGLYLLLGFGGISVLSGLTLAVLGGGTLRAMQSEKISVLSAVLLICPGFFIFSLTFHLERPQVVSFAAMLVLMALFLRFERTQGFDWRLPLLLLLWANLHGGYVVGALVLGLFSFAAVLQHRKESKVVKNVVVWTLVSWLAMLINPNGFLAFSEVAKFYQSNLMANVTEYQSTFAAFSEGSHQFALAWALAAAYFLGLLITRRFYWPQVVVVVFLVYFGLAHKRNLGLMLPAILPAIGLVWQPVMSKVSKPGVLRFISFAVLLLGTAFFSWMAVLMTNARLEGGVVRQVYPTAASEFLQKSSMEGHLFNGYEYGGYLVWTIAPKIKVFIDGRGIEPQVFEDYRKISSASKKIIDGRYEYEYLLDHYAINIVFQQIYQGDGSLQPLMLELLHRPDWVPIYLDNYVYIFVKNDKRSKQMIADYGLSAQEFNLQLLLRLNYFVTQAPQEVGYRLAKAGQLLNMGMLEEAQQEIGMIRNLAPNEKALKGLQQNLTLLQWKKARGQ